MLLLLGVTQTVSPFLLGLKIPVHVKDRAEVQETLKIIFHVQHLTEMGHISAGLGDECHAGCYDPQPSTVISPDHAH